LLLFGLLQDVAHAGEGHHVHRPRQRLGRRQLIAGFEVSINCGIWVSTEAEALRGLIDAIVLTPNEGELQIELKGNLAAMLGAAQNAKRSPETGDLSLQVVMVAGARNPLDLEFAWSAA
jgi:hypothetical protein